MEHSRNRDGSLGAGAYWQVADGKFTYSGAEAEHWSLGVVEHTRERGPEHSLAGLAGRTWNHR